MVPPEAFSISSAHALVAGTKGCAGGTHSDTFMLTVLSCANAGVTLAASSSAKNAFLIDISPSSVRALTGPLRTLLDDIIIIASMRGPTHYSHESHDNRGSKVCGQKSQSLAPDRRDCCSGNCCTLTESTISSWNARRRITCSAASAQVCLKGEPLRCSMR